MKRLFFFLGATLLAMPAAYADGLSFKDAPVTAQPACAAAQFGGFSIGGYIGAAQHTSGVIIPGDYDLNTNDEEGGTFEHDATGFAGGLQIAYDIARCNTLIGFVADATFMNVDESSRYGDLYLHESSISWMSTVRIRAGAALDNLYLYATGGIAFANFDNRVRDLDPDTGFTFPVWDSDDTRIGWTVGAGLEYALSPRWALMAEVLYADFGDEDVVGVLRRTAGGDPEEIGARFDDEVVVVKVGVNYRFRREAHIEPLK